MIPLIAKPDRGTRVYERLAAAVHRGKTAVNRGKIVGYITSGFDILLDSLVVDNDFELHLKICFLGIIKTPNRYNAI